MDETLLRAREVGRAGGGGWEVRDGEDDRANGRLSADDHPSGVPASIVE
jgi:hypothetical protein